MILLCGLVVLSVCAETDQMDQAEQVAKALEEGKNQTKELNYKKFIGETEYVSDFWTSTTIALPLKASSALTSFIGIL